MNCNFVFRGMGQSEALKEYAERKVQDKLESFIGRRRPIEADMTFAIDGHDFIVSCNVVAADGFTAHVEQIGMDMYASVDRLVDKLGAQFRRHKEKVEAYRYGTDQWGMWSSRRPGLADYRQADIGPWLDDGSPSPGWSEDGPVVVEAEDILKYERQRRKSAPAHSPDSSAH